MSKSEILPDGRREFATVQKKKCLKKTKPTAIREKTKKNKKIKCKSILKTLKKKKRRNKMQKLR